MTLASTDAVPLGREHLEAIRSRLVHAYDYDVVDHDGRRYIFIRSAGDDPNPVLDLERGLEHVPSWAAHRLAAVILLGGTRALHIPAYTALPFLEARERSDLEWAQNARAHLDARYGFTMRRAPGDPGHQERLLVRVPRERIVDVAEPDLVALADTLGPVLDAGTLQPVAVVLLVAQQDHLRFRARDFLDDIAARWETRRPSPPPAETVSPVPPSPAPPKRVVSVEPVFEIELEIPAVSEEESLRLRLATAEATLRNRFSTAGFEVQGPLHRDGLEYALNANRKVGYPRHVWARSVPVFTRTDAERALQEVRRLGCDQLLFVTAAADPEADRLLAASKVKVLIPNEVDNLVP